MADVLMPPDGGLLDTIPAGLYACQVLPQGTTLAEATDADWMFVQGFQVFDPQYDPQSEDDSDITMGGWASEGGTSNGLVINVNGLYKGAGAGEDFVPDPGLTEIIRAGEGIGDVEMVRGIRYWRVDNIDEAIEGRFLCKVRKSGGNPKELQKFEGTLVCKGKPTRLTEKPAATP